MAVEVPKHVPRHGPPGSAKKDRGAPKRRLLSADQRPYRETYTQSPDYLPKGWQDAFLEEMRMQPNVSRAARMAGVSRRTAYRHREYDEDFSDAWDDAEAEGKEKALEYLAELAESGNVAALVQLARIYGHNVDGKSDGKTQDTKITVGWDDK